ncbi:hypothetical protein FRC04_010546 [Tulasnella sp. 424]|nr:hypothetical protein FRC04_010546 [Tulasnella sp. 424]KAG8972483.1 hypothetical protein FRC05_009836 [Tulasnella sp. 425]
MDAIPHHLLTAPKIEIPDPPEEFGQDGGKFYRAYDALAEEIDDDMAKSLKEQLDGMLIFAGLFAGVNSAFLALTLPLMSADPADDTNALLAQNNAILLQLVSGGNDSTSLNPTLPSASFAPSGAILSVNVLFALSLAFAIISSFLAVLGRQWLVYYRKRGGGGPDRQRWEQLKRLLGAERWGLELILDDILPSLLQAGLIMFCISFIIYLNTLSSTLYKVSSLTLSSMDYLHGHRDNQGYYFIHEDPSDLGGTGLADAHKSSIHQPLVWLGETECSSVQLDLHHDQGHG